VKATATNPTVAPAVNLDAVAAKEEKPTIMTTIPAAIGICAIIVLGLAMSACADSGGKTLAGSAAASGDCSPGVCVGSTPGSIPDMIQFKDKVQ
jgi:hypothetical protein